MNENCTCVLTEDVVMLEQEIDGFGAEWKGIPRAALRRELREVLVRHFDYTGTCEDCGGNER